MSPFLGQAEGEPAAGEGAPLSTGETVLVIGGVVVAALVFEFISAVVSAAGAGVGTSISPIRVRTRA